MKTKLSQKLKSIAQILLDLDDTSFPKEQFELLRDMSGNHKFDLSVEDLKDLVKILKKKHMVDSITVATQNGSMLVSSNGQGVKQALIGSALFNYIKSEIPKSEAVLIKSHGWHMLIPFGEKIYIVNAASDMTHTELNAIAKEVETFLETQGDAEQQKQQAL